ncbi:hypothetical protein SDC9_190839 [bioreactor metagenome]|uniref:Uncharacterized protein n=1 Tax=bioreactor metagenome TaxID=1076179 RepID=A0A645HWP4_9ZZZZ
MLDHLVDQSGRMLQVGVHDDDRIALRVGQARVHRGFLTEVAAETHVFDPRVTFVVGLHHLQRAVTTSVVDQDQFELDIGGVDSLEDLCDQRVEHRLFVVARHHDRQQHGQTFHRGFIDASRTRQRPHQASTRLTGGPVRLGCLRVMAATTADCPGTTR